MRVVLNKHKPDYAIGLMSGTSLDGIDAALVKIVVSDSSVDLELVHFATLAYSQEVKEKILALCDPEQANITDLSAMNMYLGRRFAEAALKVIEEARCSKDDILLISSHGQTIYHQPDPVSIGGEAVTSTLQIGDISVIAEETGITTVGDFRTRDMAVGGQGAPLVPYADYLLFKKEAFGRVLVNIGGISNLTILSKGGSESDVIAYDTGPGNMIIDAFTTWVTNGEQSYDRDGRLAANGKINQQWLAELLKHPYYQQKVPKSTGREIFGVEYAEQLWRESENRGISKFDKIATVTELTAKTIAIEIKKYLEINSLKEVLISGGGRYNKTLMKRIRAQFTDAIKVMRTDEYQLPADAKEAIVFALLGYQCYRKQTNNLPSATGATRKVMMGKIAW